MCGLHGHRWVGCKASQMVRSDTASLLCFTQCIASNVRMQNMHYREMLGAYLLLCSFSQESGELEACNNWLHISSVNSYRQCTC